MANPVFDRTTVIKGPCYLSYSINGGASTVVWQSRDDVRLQFGHETFDINTSVYGVVDKRNRQRVVNVTFTPTGVWDQLPGTITYGLGTMGALYPYGNRNVGDALIGAATENDLTIIPRQGQQWTIYGAWVTRMPNMILSSTKTWVGPVTFTGIGKVSTGTSQQVFETADSIFKGVANTFADQDPLTQNIITQPWVGNWGSILTGIQTREGWTVDFEVDLDPVDIDTFGIVDWIIRELRCTASCQPIGILDTQGTLGTPNATEIMSALENILGAYGSTPGTSYQWMDTPRGGSVQIQSNLAITQGTTAGIARTVTLLNATPLLMEYNYGQSAYRIPSLSFTAVRSVPGGTQGRVFTLA